MEDAFSLFGLERRPLIDEAALKEKYLRLAAIRHPDLSGGNDEKFHLLQDAYKTLREPAARLRHLVELEFPGGGIQSESAPHTRAFHECGKCSAGGKSYFFALGEHHHCSGSRLACAGYRSGSAAGAGSIAVYPTGAGPIDGAS